MTHTSVISAVPCTAAATVAGTMKIADAIIVPALIMIASNSPSSRLRSVLTVGNCGGVVMGSQAEASARPTLSLRTVIAERRLQPVNTNDDACSVPAQLQRCVGIEIQTPPSRRPDGARQVQAHQPVEEARPDAHARQRPRER